MTNFQLLILSLNLLKTNFPMSTAGRGNSKWEIVHTKIRSTTPIGEVCSKRTDFGNCGIS